MNREADADRRTGAEVSVGGRVGMISRFMKLLQESTLLLAFVTLASSILLFGAGLISVR
jgi:hypothetical protein